MSNEAPIIVGLDIGTTKIAVIAGRKNDAGKLEILGFGRADSNGVKHGQVLNIDSVIASISLAMRRCVESNPELEVSDVYVGIAGHHIKSLPARGDLVRQDQDIEIQRSEIEQLINNQRKMFIPAGDEIIEVIPQDYQVDNIYHIKDPVGYNGVKVGANFHIITGDKHAIKNIKRAVERSNLKTSDLVLQPLASASAVTSDEDIEAGVAILDIGGGTSDLAIFHDGILKHTAVIPFGGENITEDIRVTLGVLRAQAEALKVQFGSTLASHANPNAFITIPGIKGLAPKQISVRTLAEVIQARMEEILDSVWYQLNQCGLDRKSLNGGLIITGGGSQLRHLAPLAELKTGLSVRIGLPTERLAPKHANDLKSPSYSTCIGLILKGYNDYENLQAASRALVEEKRVTVIPIPSTAKEAGPAAAPAPQPQQAAPAAKPQKTQVDVSARKKGFWEIAKVQIVKIFMEDDDNVMG